ncbi:MAG: hypothetical protein JWM98_2128 [Thermoleophilia bacterium]|nr:hypothetical protein [Thermoleophilia bacterium]
MSHDIPTSLEDLDVDGALASQIADVEEVAAGQTRGDFLKKFAVGAGATAVAASFVGPAAALGAEQKASPSGDLVILNYALTLEYLEAGFYTEAYNRNRLNRSNRYFAQVVGGHERTHVAALTATIKKLGGRPVRKPRFDFGNTTGSNGVFMQTSLALEETGVPAFLGQVPYIYNKDVLLAAGRIVTVEARHAAWMRNMLGKNPAPNAFDGRRGTAGTLKIVKGTGFIPALG